MAINLNELEGYISIANKPGRGLNSVANITKDEIYTLDRLFLTDQVHTFRQM